jgi:uncharacterized integral membrane protein
MLLAAVFFSLGNSATISISLYPSDYLLDIPLYLYSFILLITGLLGGYLLRLRKTLQMKRLLHRQAQTIDALENQAKLQAAEQAKASQTLKLSA